MTIKKEEVVSLGIVLKTHPYKESDSLVTVYFKDYGKMTLIARNGAEVHPGMDCRSTVFVEKFL